MNPLKMDHRRSSASSSTASFKELLDSEKQASRPSSRINDARANSLKLFESPLAHQRRRFSDPPTIEAQPLKISGPNDLVNPILAQERQNSESNIYDDRNNGVYCDRLTEESMRETPEFKRSEEATNMELFYDLFFVANLTTFTDVHEINDVKSIKAYAGFFCILWFLWAQVALFDVRFVQDSILERLGKVCQFGIMVGLAIVGPDFDPERQEVSVFRSLSILLMISRVVLGFQYTIILREVWYYKDTKVPLLLIVGANFGAALAYFLTFFGFKKDNLHGNVYVVWYVTAIMETIINIGVSSRWKVLSFKGTHLIKRMSLLTLIILGEGIIGISKSIAKISEQEEVWNPALLLTIAAAVGIIYFIYLLYFDWMNRDHFGSLLEGLWAFIHFPFHLALVLLVEGTSQFLLWRKVVEVVNRVNVLFARKLSATTITTSATLSEVLLNTTNIVFGAFPPEFTRTLEDAEKAISTIANATFNSTEQIKDISTLFAVIQDSIFDSFGIEQPESKSKTVDDPNAEWTKNMDAFMLIFIYFFIAAGITLLLISTLNAISRPTSIKTKSFYIKTFINFSIGILMCGLAGIVNTEAGFDLAQSAWLLPSVALAFAVVASLGYVRGLR